MRRMARWFLLSVIGLDAVFVVLFLAGGLPTAGAESDLVAAGPGLEKGEDAEEEPTDWSHEALQQLGQELELRAAELARREEELAELMRGNEVLERFGIATGEELDAQPDTGVEPEEAAPVAAVEPQPDRAAFERLQRAYANMEPDSAAQALSELAARDQSVVVELILAWQPRTSGAILDSLTQTDPGLAADLSYEIWKRSSGKNE